MSDLEETANPSPEEELPLAGQRPPSAFQLFKERQLERVPPKYRNKRYLIGGPLLSLGALLLLIQCGILGLGGGAEEVPAPVPVAEAEPEPTPTPQLSILPIMPTPLPSQYAFTHFVNEMANCFKQKGDPASLEIVEASIMADVPVAVGTLMRLYADNLCQEQEPWNQIPGRMGWMLRAGDVPLPELPEPEEPQG